jgi:penicillin-binding protein 1B
MNIKVHSHRVVKISLPAVAAVFAVGLVVFATYLWILYRQVDRAFLQQEQFIPTRIYSDVARIATPQLRVNVLERLKGLNYPFTEVPNTDPNTFGETIQFTLHTPDYPTYLVPDGHPILTLVPTGGTPPEGIVQLTFDGNAADSLLQNVRLNGREIPDLYLEPELVATLSRGPKEIREWVKFEDIPSPIWKAIIAVEDQHFLDHKGLDPRGIARAIWVDLRTHSLAQGGSTITLQLVKNLTARHGRNIIRKINELFLAVILETKFSKEEILERYLNEVYLGQIGSLEVHGVAEGANYFFGRNLEDLNLAEIALLAGQIRGTGYYSPYTHKDRAIQRMHIVLQKMVETGQIAEAEEKAALKMPVRLSPPTNIYNKAPYFTDYVRAELYRQLKDRMTEEEINRAGFKVYTTLDIQLNHLAQQSVAEGIIKLEKQLKIDSVAHPEDRIEGALASVDQTNGYIRTLVGGRSYAQSTFNRILNMKRQIGSTFKPLVYLTGILKGEDANGVPYAPGHPAEDAPWTLIYDKGHQTWTPKNYEKENLGWIDYRTALAHSNNIVTAKLGVELGIDNIIVTAHSLGIDTELPNVPSLSLGIAELSPVELLRTYAILANHGVQDELTVFRSIVHDDNSTYARFVYHPKQVLDPGAADLLTDMLQTVFTEGTAKFAVDMGFDRPAAGKTGTTSHHRDSWFAGYTPQLTTVVWVGSDQTPTTKEALSRKSKITLTGATSALPIWANFMKGALAGEPPAQFPMSPDLSDIGIDIKSGLRARSDCSASQIKVEKFWKAREPKNASCSLNWPPSFDKTTIQ